VIRSETAGGQHAVDMMMMLQSLVPGVEHAEEADLRLQGGKLSRKQLLHFTAILQVELIGMEACDAGVLPASFFVNGSQESPFPMTHAMSALSELSLPSRARNG
jgi:hypothetical protein